MRKKEQAGDLSVQAIAGTHVVLLGMNLPQEKCPGLLGFALRREDHTEGEKYWLSGYKTFESVEPHPANGVLYSTRVHPIQGFTWSDFSAKPAHEYTYEVIALRGNPAQPTAAETVKVKVTTEDEKLEGSTHHVHFNRGASASQEYTRRFGDKRPGEVGPSAYEWLSRGAAEAIRKFIERAKGPGCGLRIGAYEFTEDHVLQSLQDAWKVRKVDVQILYHAANDTTKISNEKEITKFGLEPICTARRAKGLSLSHNKMIILTRAGKPQAVLTGSTNFSDGGIYGHSNVVHICENNKIAEKYLSLWNELKKNGDKKDVAPLLAAMTPLPAHSKVKQTIPVFSPRPDLSALEWYAKEAVDAEAALFMTFAFGMHESFRNAYANGTAGLRYALMEKMSGPTRTEEQRIANEKLIIDLRKKEENKFAIGAHLPLGAFDRWANEKLSGLNVNVRYLHTKYLLVDPLGPHPLVVTGSANFSEASTKDNDENMLVLRGDKRVADIYLGEFMRLYNHFAFRDWLTHHPDLGNAKISHLDENDKWWAGYFGGSFASRQRQYFAG